MRIEYDRQADFLVVKIIGEWTESNAIDSIENIKSEVEITGLKKILFDLQELSHPETQLIRHNSGKKIAEALPFYKIAGFSQAEKINHLAEITANNRGANFKMFKSESEALHWLMEE